MAWADKPTWRGRNLGWDFDGSINRVPHWHASASAVDDFGDLILLRRCGHCRRWLERSTEHFAVRERFESGHTKKLDGWCRDCRREARRTYYARTPAVQAKARRRAKHYRQMQNPEWHERRKARNREYQRQRRAENPEREKEIQRRARERLKNDPVRYARALETRRIQHRLRRERAGFPVREPKVDGGHVGPEIPLQPLLEAIERLHTQREGQGDEYVAFCEWLGISDKTLREWRQGKRKAVRFSTVDKILQNVGWLWWDVYAKPVNGHAGDAEAWEAYRAASMAFEGEVVE